MPTPTITDRLDQLEANLPAVPARIVRLQRSLAGAWYNQTAAIVGAVTGSTKSFLDTTRTSGKTVTGQARAAVEDVASTARTGAKTVTGQAKAQGRRISDTASTETTALLDSAIDAVDSQLDHPGSGTPYEQWTKAQLLERATELDVEGRSGMNKSQLIKALRSDQPDRGRSTRLARPARVEQARGTCPNLGEHGDASSDSGHGSSRRSTSR